MILYTNELENSRKVKISSEGDSLVTLEILDKEEICTGKITITIDKLREAYELFTNSVLSDDVFIAITDELNKISKKETAMSISKQLLDLCESVISPSEDGVYSTKDESGQELFLIKKDGKVTTLTAEDFDKVLEICGNSGLVITDTGLPTGDEEDLDDEDKDVIQSELDGNPVCDPETDPDCEYEDDEYEYEESFYEAVEKFSENFEVQKVDEANPVVMYRGGVKVLDCPPGFKIDGKSCKRMGSIELRNRQRAAKKSALKRKGRKRKMTAASRLKAAKSRTMNKRLNVADKKSAW